MGLLSFQQFHSNCAVTDRSFLEAQGRGSQEAVARAVPYLPHPHTHLCMNDAVVSKGLSTANIGAGDLEREQVSAQ